MSELLPIQQLLKHKINSNDKGFISLSKSLDYIHTHNLAKEKLFPPYCYAPLNLNTGNINDLETQEDIKFDWLLSIWRKTQGIYRFDNDLLESFNSILTSDMDLPVDPLLNLPEWVIYCDLEDAKIVRKIDPEVKGFLVGINAVELKRGNSSIGATITIGLVSYSDKNDPLADLKYKILNFPLYQSLKQSIRLTQIIISSINQDTTTESLSELDAKFQDTESYKMLNLIFSMLLYLTSQASDIENSSNKALVPKKPKAVKLKNSYKVFPPENASIWNVGYRIGSDLRKAQASLSQQNTTSSQHSSPRPHIRRAHWHGYWVGSKKENNQKFILKWIPPTLINVTEDNPIVGTIKNIT